GPDTPLGELMRRAGPRAVAPGGWQGRVTLQGQEGPREVAADVLPLSAGRFLCLLGPVEAARAGLRTRSSDGDAESHFRTLADSAPVMVWICSADRLVEWVNRPWLAYTGRTLEQERGNGWFDGVHDEDLERVTGIFDT